MTKNAAEDVLVDVSHEGAQARPGIPAGEGEHPGD